MTNPKNQLHAAGSPTKHGGFHRDEEIRKLVGLTTPKVKNCTLSLTYSGAFPVTTVEISFPASLVWTRSI